MPEEIGDANGMQSGIIVIESKTEQTAVHLSDKLRASFITSGLKAHDPWKVTE